MTVVRSEESPPEGVAEAEAIESRTELVLEADTAWDVDEPDESAEIKDETSIATGVGEGGDEVDVNQRLERAIEAVRVLVVVAARPTPYVAIARGLGAEDRGDESPRTTSDRLAIHARKADPISLISLMSTCGMPVGCFQPLSRRRQYLQVEVNTSLKDGRPSARAYEVEAGAVPV
ncbi:unnamed protein product [Diplocarpon coronariae]